MVFIRGVKYALHFFFFNLGFVPLSFPRNIFNEAASNVYNKCLCAFLFLQLFFYMNIRGEVLWNYGCQVLKCGVSMLGTDKLMQKCAWSAFATNFHMWFAYKYSSNCIYRRHTVITTISLSLCRNFLYCSSFSLLI